MAQTRTFLPTPQTYTGLGLGHRLLHLDWTYAATEKRDLRLDLLRGFAVFAMVVDHWGGPSWFYLVTGGNTFWVSAAEAFVFISGLVVGMVYGGIALKEGLRSAQIKALRRAFTLYKLTVVLTLSFGTISLFFNLPWVRDLKLENPLTFVFDAITLRQTIYLTDIPLMYTFMMLAAPFGLWLLVKGRTHWLVAGSVGLWGLSQLFPTQVQIPWTVSGSTTFDLAAWQLLFFAAMVLGYHHDELSKKLSALPRLPYFVLASLLVILLIQFHDNDGTLLARIVPTMNTDAFLSSFFSKNMLAPGRLIASFIVFQFAYLATTMLWKPIRAMLGWFLVPLGQNSLYSYTMHVFVIGMLAILVPRFPGEITSLGIVNTSVQFIGVLAIWVMIRQQFLFKLVPR